VRQLFVKINRRLPRPRRPRPDPLLPQPTTKTNSSVQSRRRSSSVSFSDLSTSLW
jgi:hypothetical protein